MQLGKIMNYQINISPTHNKGFTVDIGCGKFVFTDIDEMLTALKNYLYAPKEWEKKYTESLGAETATVRDREPDDAPDREPTRR